MFVLPVTYENFEGTEVKETLHFHFSKQELIHMQVNEEGGLAKRLQKIIDAQDNNEAIKEIRWMVLKSYGELSPNGNRFHKSPEIEEDFESSPAFDVVFMKLFSDPEFSGQFIQGILPKGIDVDELKKEMGNLGGDPNALFVGA